MAPKRRYFGRKFGEDSYKRRFVIATEGRKTEPQYFKNHISLWWNVAYLLPPNDKSSPCQVLKQMERSPRQGRLKPKDELWLVIDNDQNSKKLDQLHHWEQGDKNNIALSYPNFEYWLLLHFEDGNNIRTPEECIEQLTRYLPNYDKTIDKNQFSRKQIDDAICRAKNRDQSLGLGGPSSLSSDRLNAFGNTTVYKLVEKLLKDE